MLNHRSALKSLRAKSAIVALSLAAMASQAGAAEIRYAFGFADSYPPYQALVRFSAALKANSDIDLQLYPLSLLSLAETPAGLRDGIADAGWVNFAYTPVEYSNTNLIANLSMVVTAGAPAKYPEAAMTGAMMEYVMLNCPECVSQFSAQGQVYLAGTTIPPYDLVCNKKDIVTAEDVRGARLRSGAGNFTRWAEHFGATPVSLPGNEIYDSLSQGVVDCTMNALADAVGQRYVDVATSITLGAPGGVYAAQNVLNLSLTKWQELSAEQRGILLKEAARLTADTVNVYHTTNAAGLAAVREKGLKVNEASPELRAASTAFVTSDLAVIKTQFTDQFKVENVEAKLELAQSLITKWKTITEPVGGDIEALSKLYWDEILSKVDPKTYAVN